MHITKRKIAPFQKFKANNAFSHKLLVFNNLNAVADVGKHFLLAMFVAKNTKEFSLLPVLRTGNYKTACTFVVQVGCTSLHFCSIQVAFIQSSLPDAGMAEWEEASSWVGVKEDWGTRETIFNSTPHCSTRSSYPYLVLLKRHMHI